jgi:hypothetical protein
MTSLWNPRWNRWVESDRVPPRDAARPPDTGDTPPETAHAPSQSTRRDRPVHPDRERTGEPAFWQRFMDPGEPGGGHRASAPFATVAPDRAWAANDAE